MFCPLRIIAHEIHPLRIVLREPIRTSFGVMTHRQACLLELTTDEGVSGWGESWINYPQWGLEERVATLRALADHVIGRHFSEPQQLTTHLLRSFSAVARQWGALGPIYQSVSAIDLALWDIQGKTRGISVRQLLGASERAVPAYASGIGPGQIEDRLAEAQRLGLRAAKIKVGFGFDADRNNVQTARSLWGDHALMLDANQGWHYNEALAVLPVLAEYRPYWIEEPLAADDWEGLAELTKDVSIPVALGENLYGKDFNRIVEDTDVRYIQPDLAKMGGWSKALEVLQTVAADTSKVVLPHVFGTALSVVIGAHFSAVARSPWLELDLNPNPFREDLLENPFTVRDGMVEVPDGPGWGVEIDRTFLKMTRA